MNEQPIEIKYLAPMKLAREMDNFRFWEALAKSHGVLHVVIEGNTTEPGLIQWRDLENGNVGYARNHYDGLYTEVRKTELTDEEKRLIEQVGS